MGAARGRSWSVAPVPSGEDGAPPFAGRRHEQCGEGHGTVEPDAVDTGVFVILDSAHPPGRSVETETRGEQIPPTLCAVPVDLDAGLDEQMAREDERGGSEPLGDGGPPGDGAEAGPTVPHP